MLLNPKIVRGITSNLNKNNAALNTNIKKITGNELDNIKSNGNYTVYITQSSSDEKFLAGCLIFLEVREIRIDGKLGYLQRASTIYDAPARYRTLTRAFYLGAWKSWW